MLSEHLKKKSLFYRLYTIDKETAERLKKEPCQHCGGPLHFSNYYRKPRGEPEGIQQEYFLQFSLCCGKEGCRKRRQCPSCRFLGRKVYWFSVILSIVSDWQNGHLPDTFLRLSTTTGISRQTIKRWIMFFHDIFPTSKLWKKLRGQVSASVNNTDLPSNLINYYLSLKSCATEVLVSCLIFLSGKPESHQKIRAR